MKPYAPIAAGRKLAEQLASAGLPVLRFDYPGTGDSAGEEAPNRIADWLASIHGGADWLRRKAGVKQVALCGLRLGATLAATAAAQCPDSVDALILLAPIAIGRMHIRELTLAAATNSGTTQLPDWLESAGFRFHISDVTTLRNLDLSEALARAKPPQVLIADVVNRPALNAASLAKLADLGVSIKQMTFTGYEAYLRHSHLSTVPAGVFGHVVDWTLAGAACGQKSVSYIANDRLECQRGVTERIVRFGGVRQFGRRALRAIGS